MRKLFAAVLICSVVVAALAAFFIWNPPRIAPPLVGIVLYVWGDPASEESWNRTKIVDRPVLGYYDSSDPAIIRQQLLQIEEMIPSGLVVISWWGFYDDYGRFNDNAAKQVFETAQSINSTLQFAIMIEPFNKTGYYYDYDRIYNHVFDNFVELCPDLYFNYNGKPLICFFNNPSLTDNGTFPQDNESRFSVITVGQQNYTQWIYTDLNKYDSPQHDPLRQVSVTPRIDDSRFRTPPCIVDQNLTDGAYDQEWRKAIQLAKDGKIDFILISSWNEYVERTQIEPHIDGTAKVDPYFLYDKTKAYIRQLGQLTYDMNVQVHGEDYNALTPSHLSDLGATWVRMDYEIGKTEATMTTLHNEGYKVLAIIDSRTAGPFTALEAWNATLLEVISNPVSQLVDAWEIWNEPNALPKFGGAYVAPSDYREMLRCAYGILKDSTKGIVISGGLAPHTNFASYLNETFGNSDINVYYDYFGLHLYNETLPVNLGYIDEARTVTGKGIWITEMGRPSETENYTEETQASYLADNILGISPKVERIFVYELYDHTGPSNDKECYFGLLTTEYEMKPAYYRLKELGSSPIEGVSPKP